MSENNSSFATDPNAGKYEIDAKRGKTYNRRQPRENMGPSVGHIQTSPNARKHEETNTLLALIFFFL